MAASRNGAPRAESLPSETSLKSPGITAEEIREECRPARGSPLQLSPDDCPAERARSLAN